jgi:hypothetical protein
VLVLILAPMVMCLSADLGSHVIVLILAHLVVCVSADLGSYGCMS